MLNPVLGFGFVEYENPRDAEVCTNLSSLLIAKVSVLYFLDHVQSFCFDETSRG